MGLWRKSQRNQKLVVAPERKDFCLSLVAQMFENNRVKFYMQTEVSELREQEGKVQWLVLHRS